MKIEVIIFQQESITNGFLISSNTSIFLKRFFFFWLKINELEKTFQY